METVKCNCRIRRRTCGTVRLTGKSAEEEEADPGLMPKPELRYIGRKEMNWP